MNFFKHFGRRLECGILLSHERLLYQSQTPKFLKLSSHRFSINHLSKNEGSFSINDSLIIANKSKVYPLEPYSNARSAPSQTAGVIARFKNAYKIYGKTLLYVHTATSLFWFSVLYMTAKSGVDIPATLTKIHAPQWLIEKTVPGVGGSTAIMTVTYVMYKIITPIRYPTSLYITKLVVNGLRSAGYVPPIREQDKLTNLAREGVSLQRTRMRNRFLVHRRIAQQRAKDLTKRYKLRP